jgi:hypothetical protein
MAYIGRTTDGFGVRQRFLFTPDAGATSVSGTDASGATLTFSDSVYMDVFLNGVLLKAGTDYNTNTANTIAGLTATVANDEVTVLVYDIFTTADMVSATSGGTFSGAVTFGSTVSGLDVNGTEIILDADADTSITADTDDQIDIRISGADDFQLTANTFTALSGSSIATNTITETTSGSGVTIDSVLLKDGGIDVNGNEIILDADADTSITADTDDQIDFKTAGTDRLSIDASGFINHIFTSDNSTTAEGLFINNRQNSTGNNASLIFSNDSGGRKKAAIAHIDTGDYGTGDLVFSLDGADSGALHLTNDEKMRISNGGDVTIKDGNLVIGTSGHGIDFSATSDATDKDNELFDDYEEGLFTFGSNGNIGFVSGTNIGRYIKIGKLVHVQLQIDLTSVSSTNHFYISGLPFTNASSTSGTYNTAVSAVAMCYNVNFSADYVCASIGTGSSNIYFYEVIDNANWSILTNSEMLSSSEMIVTMQYEAA